jgi:hypothetical protein
MGTRRSWCKGAKLAILEEVERNGIAQTSRKHSSPTKKGGDVSITTLMNVSC